MKIRASLELFNVYQKPKEGKFKILKLSSRLLLSSF